VLLKMKCVIPEIAYHNRDPVLSVDFQHCDGKIVRLATGGSDTHVVIWSVTKNEEGAVELDCLSDLTRHQRAVNIVRWSPDGSMLASGDDESVIIVWQLRAGHSDGGLFDDAQENKENWVVYKMIRFHLDDVYDLSWSPCGQFLLSGSVDNSAIVSNVHKNTKVSHFSDSRGFVQGVSWNKKYNILSTIGSDRSCRTYNNTTKKLVTKIYKSVLNMKDEKPKKRKDVKEGNQVPSTASSEVADKMETGEVCSENMTLLEKEKVKAEVTKDKEVRLFHDETFKGFFRRLSWSNDGEILVVPSGVIETESDAKVAHCCWVFSRVDLSKPALCLPTKEKYTIAVRFSPIYYELRSPMKKTQVGNNESSPWKVANSLFCLPYRLIYAVATQNAIMFYDTQQIAPFARVSNVHYTGLTDLTWSPCGTILLASSSDGYCSIITFTSGELGQVYTKPASGEFHEKTTPSKHPNKSSNANKNTIPAGLNSEGVLSPAQVHIKSSKEGGKANPKRLQFITLSSPKAEKKLGGNNKVVVKEDTKKIGTAGVEKMDIETDELSLVLEDTQPEMPLTIQSNNKETDIGSNPKKRTPLTTLSSGPLQSTVGPAAATPEKLKGRRVNLITLSSPKPK